MAGTDQQTNTPDSPVRENGSIRFSLKTLLLVGGITAIGTAVFGRMALGMLSLNELRQLALFAAYLAVIAFLLTAASYSGPKGGKQGAVLLRYGLVGMLAGVVIGPMLSWQRFWPEGGDILAEDKVGTNLFWVPVGGLLGGLLVVGAVRLLWWYRDRLSARWWVVGIVVLLFAPAAFVLYRDWNHPEETILAELQASGAQVRRSDFNGNALGVTFVGGSEISDAEIVRLAARLKELESLRYVYFVNCPDITFASIELLHSELTECQIKKY